MKEVVIISNLKDSDAKSEDTALAKFLEKYFKTEVLDIFDKSLFSRSSFFLVRNVWGRPNGLEYMMKIYQDFDKRNIKYSNQYYGRGDQKGKQYLVDLYEAGYQVVPTFNDDKEALKIESKEYLLKPVFGGSGKGIISVLTDDLKNKFDGKKYLIQPKIKFSFEISIFFVDNYFHHAFKTVDGRWDLELYDPTLTELALAFQFVEWNPIKGIQRLDFLKTVTGDLLLLELEDWCPYLSLLDVKNFPVDSFVNKIAKSIMSF